MTRHHLPRLSALALAVAAAAATAAPVIDADSAASAGGVAGTPSKSTSIPGYVGSSTNASGDDGSSYGYGFAKTNGAYAVSANAGGIAAGSGHAQFATTVTNNSGGALAYTLNFHIYGGSLSTSVSETLSGSESLTSSYTANIKVGGNSVFFSSATLTAKAGDAYTQTKSGVDLNGNDTTADGAYSWAAQDFVVALGTLADGQSFDVLALLDDAATADVGTYDYGSGCCSPYGDNYGGCYPTAARMVSTQALIAEPGCTDFKGRSYAFYGDPAGLFANGNGFTINAVGTVVPEPGSLVLAGAALTGLAAARRRRRR